MSGLTEIRSKDRYTLCLHLTRRRSSWIDRWPPAPEGGGGISKNCWPRWPPQSQSLIGYPYHLLLLSSFYFNTMPPSRYTEKGISTATLKRIKRNNPNLTNLWVRQCKSDDTFTQFTSASGCDFALLGQYIGENTCLQSVAEIIKVFTSNNTRSFIEFCNGLRHNSSIN